jgi:amidase
MSGAVAIASAVAARERSAVEVFEAYLAAIEARDGELNALVLPRFEAARAEAAEIDAALARGERVGPLAGVPFTCKDPLPVAGMRSPNGSRLLADYTCPTDCEPVRRLRAAGAILLGKTNVPEFCAHWDSTNALFGSTRNPHDTSRSAGGSSGGEAAAVAAGMSALGLGSDLGGSIRAPAHFCGIYGLRTGRGVVPLAAHHPLPLSPGVRLMGTLGPLARTLADVELALSVLAPHAAPARPVRTIAVFEDDDLQPVSRACRGAVREAAATLAETYHVVAARPPAQDAARRLVDGIFSEELGELAHFVADRDDELSDYARPLVRFAREHEPSIARYIAAFDALAEIEDEARAWFERHPVALCPVAPDVAPPVGTPEWPPVDGEPPRPGGKLTLCTYANALGLPALAVPITTTPDGLPVGVQLIAWHGGERTLLEVARRLT